MSGKLGTLIWLPLLEFHRTTLSNVNAHAIYWQIFELWLSAKFSAPSSGNFSNVSTFFIPSSGKNQIHEL